MCAVLLMFYRAQLSKAYERGYDTAIDDAAKAADEAGKAMAQQLKEASQGLGKQVTRSERAAAKQREKVDAEYRNNPAAGARVLVADDVVRRAQADRDAVLAQGRGRAGDD